MKSRNVQKLFGVVGAGMAQMVGDGVKRVPKTRAGGYGLRLGLGLLLAHASILGGVSPFGVAFVAAQRPGVAAAFAALGAALGYLLLGVDVGLRYIAVCVLALSAGMVFRDTKMAAHAFFMPISACLLSAVTGLIYWVAQEMDTVGLVLLVTELLMIIGFTYLFQTALSSSVPKQQDRQFEAQRAGGYLLIGACSLLSLSGLVVGGILSPARIVAVCAVLLCAHRGGSGVGAATGLCTGLVLDLGLGVPFYSMSYGSAGLLSGVFRRTGKLWTALAFVCTGAVSALWALDGPHRLSVMLEIFIASVIFMMIPDSAFGALNAVLKVHTEENTLHADRIRDFSERRLRGTANAFTSVHTALSASLAQAAVYTDGMEGVFDRTSKEVCTNCPKIDQCWDNQLPSTCAAIRDAAKHCETRGRLDKNDLSGYFAANCVRFKQFMNVGNREISNMLYRRQYQARVREGRGILCHQYAEFGRILTTVASELQESPLFDNEAEYRLIQWLKTKQLTAQVSVYAAPGGRMCAEISGDNLSILLTDKRTLIREVSRTLGWMVNEPEALSVASLDRLLLWESEPVLATLGVAAHKRTGQAVSGDSGASFKTNEGQLYLILADGMGSGVEAAIESREAVKLLEGFLRAGIAPKSALAAMNSALLLKGADSTIFVTLDLLVVDLLEGRMTSYKYGAAPTYIKRGGQVKRVTGNALPGGLDDTGEPDVFTQPLSSGQWIIMTTDGITDAEEDAWLCEYVQTLTMGDAPRDVAARVLQQAIARGGAADDMTVLALRTQARRTRP